jgi:hypothetical protein
MPMTIRAKAKVAIRTTSRAKTMSTKALAMLFIIEIIVVSFHGIDVPY